MKKLNPPNQEIIINKSIHLILDALLAIDDDLPFKAEQKLAQAVIILNQLGNIESFHDVDKEEMFKHCRNIILGK
jgi:hypothetical protein